jgi:acetyl esterase/lipase
MSTKYDLAPEFVSQPRITIPSNRLLLLGINLLLRLQRRRFAWSDRVSVRTHSVRGTDGNAIPVLEIAPKDLSVAAPAIVDYHGGGFFLPYLPLHLTAAERYAAEGRCRVFFPDYRLSVDHPFPAGFDDCRGAHVKMMGTRFRPSYTGCSHSRDGKTGIEGGANFDVRLREGEKPVGTLMLSCERTDR